MNYGNCYTFNSGYNKKLQVLRNGTQSGSYYGKHKCISLYCYRLYYLSYISKGLTVELFLDQSNYMLTKLSQKVGARLVVHDPDKKPLVDQYGIDLHPNTVSSISIQQVISYFSLKNYVLLAFLIINIYFAGINKKIKSTLQNKLFIQLGQYWI